MLPVEIWDARNTFRTEWERENGSQKDSKTKDENFPIKLDHPFSLVHGTLCALELND